mgnify:CR=1 FL=1
MFETVLRLKSRQCRRTGVADFFGWDWARTLVEQVWQDESPDCAGRLSALYAGDTLVAAHLGMRSPQAWHWWFPVYASAHAAHSPGALLLPQAASKMAWLPYLAVSQALTTGTPPTAVISPSVASLLLRVIDSSINPCSVSICPARKGASALRALAAVGFNITSIRDVTPLAHNGCRPPKRRRV